MFQDSRSVAEQTSQNPSQLESACEGGSAGHWGPIPGPAPALEGPEKRCEPVWGLVHGGKWSPCLHPESKDQNPATVAPCSQGRSDSHRHLKVEGASWRQKETARTSPSPLSYIPRTNCHVLAFDSLRVGVLPPPAPHSQRGCFTALLLHPTSSAAGPIGCRVPSHFLAVG